MTRVSRKSRLPCSACGCHLWSDLEIQAPPVSWLCIDQHIISLVYSLCGWKNKIASKGIHDRFAIIYPQNLLYCSYPYLIFLNSNLPKKKVENSITVFPEIEKQILVDSWTILTFKTLDRIFIVVGGGLILVFLHILMSVCDWVCVCVFSD